MKFVTLLAISTLLAACSGPALMTERETCRFVCEQAVEDYVDVEKHIWVVGTNKARACRKQCEVTYE